VPGLAFFGATDLALYQGDLIVAGGFQVFAPDGHARHIVRLDLDTARLEADERVCDGAREHDPTVDRKV